MPPLTKDEYLDLPRISEDNEVQFRYEQMRLEGTSHTLAEMFALQKGPGVRTDSTFLHGHCNGNQFESEPWAGDFYAQEAKRHGVNITGKVYKAGLASYPGDPMAWVSGRGDVERVAKAKGMKVEGDVKCDFTQENDGPPPDIDVADDVVEQRVMEMMDNNPDLEHTRKPADVFAEAREAIKPPWAA